MFNYQSLLVTLNNTNLSMTPPESPLLPLLGTRESSSSKNITQGVALLALTNTEILNKYTQNVIKQEKNERQATQL